MEYRLRHRDDSYRWVLCRGTLQRNYQGRPYRFAGSHTDITNRKTVEQRLQESQLHLQDKAHVLEKTLQELQTTQLQLIQSEKMSSLGQLVAGIAHELNNPISFIHGNMHYLQDYSKELLQIIETLQNHPDASDHQKNLLANFDLEFIQSDLPRLLDSMKTGTQRIRSLALSLRNFSRIDESEKKMVDLHEGLESTLLILSHRLSPPLLDQTRMLEIKVDRHYGNLPEIDCYPSQMNQVFMNVLVNAIDAIQDRFTRDLAQDQWPINSHVFDSQVVPRITIETYRVGSDVVVAIADNGVGIPEQQRSRIFDPFFTTKPIGQGTGLELSIAYQIIVEQHNGRLQCYSEPNRGTRFEISIPLQTAKPQTITDQPQQLAHLRLA